MVIGNPTPAEESAIYCERNRKGDTGDPSSGGEEKVPTCLRYRLQAAIAAQKAEWGDRKEMALDQNVEFFYSSKGPNNCYN